MPALPSCSALLKDISQLNITCKNKWALHQWPSVIPLRTWTWQNIIIICREFKCLVFSNLVNRFLVGFTQQNKKFSASIINPENLWRRLRSRKKFRSTYWRFSVLCWLSDVILFDTTVGFSNRKHLFFNLTMAVRCDLFSLYSKTIHLMKHFVRNLLNLFIVPALCVIFIMLYCLAQHHCLLQSKPSYNTALEIQNRIS